MSSCASAAHAGIQRGEQTAVGGVDARLIFINPLTGDQHVAVIVQRLIDVAVEVVIVKITPP
ncbi:hypothetical protein D3C87_2181040 [compost metagenome]